MYFHKCTFIFPSLTTPISQVQQLFYFYLLILQPFVFHNLFKSTIHCIYHCSFQLLVLCIPIVHILLSLFNLTMNSSKYSLSAILKPKARDSQDPSINCSISTLQFHFLCGQVPPKHENYPLTSLQTLKPHMGTL